jgi:hypothetical protein
MVHDDDNEKNEKIMCWSGAYRTSDVVSCHGNTSFILDFRHQPEKPEGIVYVSVALSSSASHIGWV